LVPCREENRNAVKKIGVVVKPDARAKRQADALEKWLDDKGWEVVRRKSVPPEGQPAVGRGSQAPADLHCVFVLGGDGTFLSAVRWIGEQDIPILGVKFGEVGFLAEITEESLFATAEAVLEGRLKTRPRMRLRVEVVREGETIVDQTLLNEVVINKGALARLADIDTFIDDKYLTTYRADGLIVATPTGSTAYALAAGGPIIHPQVAGIILAPICPFTLTNRPLIVPDSVKIGLKLEKKAADIWVTFDGQAGLKVEDRDTIRIRKSAHPISLITIPDQDYFDVLKAKLRWSGGRT
jgi:NAD+ kinase